MKAKDRRKQNQSGCCAGCGQTVKSVGEAYTIDSLKIKPIGPGDNYTGESVDHRKPDYLHRLDGPSSPPSPQCLDAYGRRVLASRIPDTKDYRRGAVAVVNDEQEVIVKR